MSLFQYFPKKVATVFVLLALTACGDVQDVTEPEPPRAASLSVSPATVELGVPGETAELTVTVLDQHGNAFPAPFTWSSEDASIISVDQDGLATAVARGTAAIRVVAGDLSAVVHASVNSSSTDGVCDRTPQVRDALMAATNRAECAQVSAGLLARLRRLDLSGPHEDTTSASAADCPEAIAAEFERGGPPTSCESRPSGPAGTGAVFMDMAGADGEDERIISLRDGDFEGLSGLVFLDLSHNFLRGLPDSVFAEVANLDTLNLEENLLASLPEGVFGALTGLEYLDLSANALTALPDSSFSGFTALKKLYLDDNWLTTVPQGTFADMTALDTLWLGGNELETLPDGVFDNLTELKGLRLSGNRLSALPAGAFDDLTSLEYLTLSANRLTELNEGVFDNITDVKNLYFSRNRLASLPEGAFDGLGELNYLSIYANRITELADGVFADLTGLDTLAVSFNRLSELPDGVLDGLDDLDLLSLGANQLTELPDGLLDDLGDLTELYLERNDLTRLPEGVFQGTPDLKNLSVFGNALTELPRGVFAGLTSLEILWLEDNLTDPFPLTLEAVRADNEDPVAEGPAQIGIAVREGAPFDMRLVFGARGGEPRSTVVSIAAGDTLSRLVTVTRREGSVSQYIQLDSLPATPEDECEGFLCFDGITPVAGEPLVLVNPPDLKVEAQAAYLVQATQSYAGKVPLVADREALLRVFVTADFLNSYRPSARATFYLDDEEIHVADMTAPSGLPRRVDESSLNASFNAMIPDSVLQPGLEMVVEIDPDSTLSTLTGSQMRIPATGRQSLDVRTLPPLDVTLVPVAFESENSRVDNAPVAALVADLATSNSHAALQETQVLLPLSELNISVREPYTTQADTVEEGGFGLLDEIRLLRFIEAGATNDYYHGILALPASRYRPVWGFGGVAYIGGWAGLTLSHVAGVYRGDGRFGSTLAHELGHNLSLRHAPGCGAGGPDPDYPYTDAYTGVWGVDFSTGGDYGRLISPARYRDFMSYCDPAWASDFSFTKALEYRMGLPPAPTAPAGRRAVEKTLLLWGRVQDGELRLEPVFEWETPVKLPSSPGPYRLEGIDAAGGRMFSMSFAPDRVDHGGAGFLFAVPVEEGRADELARVTLSGPEGVATLDRDGGRGGAIVTSRSTGRVLSIVRDWSRVRPESLGTTAEVSVSRSVLVREVRER